MASFNYKAKRGLVDSVEGTIDAQDQGEAMQKIEQMGLFPVSVMVPPLAAQPPVGQASPKPKKRRTAISSVEILHFVKKLTTLTRAQVELLSSLRILYEQADNPVFQEMLLGIYNTTKEGKSFSVALARYPKVFSPLFVSIIRAGEASGRLDSSLEQISEFMTRDEGLRNKVRIALAYPALLSVVGIVSVFILLNFVVPKLKPLLDGMGKDLPLITKIVLQLSLFVNKTWAPGFILLFAGAAFLYRQRGMASFHLFIRKIARVIPVIDRLARSQELTHFTQALALLLKSGIPALTAFEIALQTAEDPVMRADLSKACRLITGGETISKALAQQTKLPDFFIKMVAIGEETGKLVSVLDEIAYSYRQQIEVDIAVVASLLEPLLILILGVIMGSIVIAILLPTFEMSQFIR